MVCSIRGTMALCTCVKVLILLIVCHTVCSQFAISGIQAQDHKTVVENAGVSDSSREDGSNAIYSIPVSQRARPNSPSGGYTSISSHDALESALSVRDVRSAHGPSDNESNHPPPLQTTTNASTPNRSSTNDHSDPYSVTSPFGVDGQPLLTGSSTQGYGAGPQSNAIITNRPSDDPNRFPTNAFWDGWDSNPKPSGIQWSNSPYWNSRRSGGAGRFDPRNGDRFVSQGLDHTEQNQQLVRSILTQALDIITARPSDNPMVCRNDRGVIVPCDPSDSKRPKTVKEKSKKRCVDGASGRPCAKPSSYPEVFWPLVQKMENNAKQTRPGDDDVMSAGSDWRVGNEDRRRGGSNLGPGRTRTAFRSVETSPTSSLARLFNSDSSSGTVGDNGGGGGQGVTGSANNNGQGNSGNGGGGGGSASGGAGGRDSPTPPPGVDLDVFNQFARDVVSFEQQSATEIKRLDNLLRQLAMAAQTDFTSVSNDVSSLQRELAQTQQQLVQAWSILNATHVRDNIQTVGDLHDVKTDVYRLHALLTGATPLGQGTAHGRAAEVKEVVTVGPGVDCAALYKSGVNTSGVYDLQPQPSDNRTRMTAFCDMDTDGGGWTVFQRRRDGSDDFFRGWNSYKHGFGSYKHDHWLGLENIHLLTKYGDNVMRIELTDWDNETRWAEFSYTRIMDESDGYRILVGGHRGTAGDPFHSLSYSMRMQSMRFSTFDSDNDLDIGGNCALTFTSGWWFNKCFQVNLNGVWYGDSRYAGPSMNGIVWDLWPQHFNGYSLKHTEMKLRPADFLPQK